MNSVTRAERRLLARRPDGTFRHHVFGLRGNSSQKYCRWSGDGQPGLCTPYRRARSPLRVDLEYPPSCYGVITTNSDDMSCAAITIKARCVATPFPPWKRWRGNPELVFHVSNSYITVQWCTVKHMELLPKPSPHGTTLGLASDYLCT